MNATLNNYLVPTFFIDTEHPEIVDYAISHCKNAKTDIDKAISLYYAVRDEIRYDPYDLQYSKEAMKASSVLNKRSGYCVSKALLLATLGRQQNIPCRLGFADVTNHLSTEKLLHKMGTDLFVYHGYTEMYLENRWVKATPTFNISLCMRFKVKPLEFDGTSDALFHEFNAKGEKHMEYVRDHGHFSDLPFERLFAAYQKTYPNFFTHFGKSNSNAASEKPDTFEKRQVS